jgi:hypothetical protein
MSEQSRTLSVDDKEELEYLLAHRLYISERIDFLRTKIKNSKQPERTLKDATRREYGGWWVATACLAPYVTAWMKEGHSAQALADKVETSSTTIFHIRDGGTEWTRDEIAEAIMLELGLQHVYQNFEKVRIRRKVMPVPVEPPPSHYFEE